MHVDVHVWASWYNEMYPCRILELCSITSEMQEKHQKCLLSECINYLTKNSYFFDVFASERE